jgi:hypothetical protein
MKIIVGIDVCNLQIRAFRPEPEIQTAAATATTAAMPNDDAGKMVFWNSVEPNRLNKRQLGYLKGKALRKAERIVDKNGGINISGEYGSIEVDEQDFIPIK